MAITKLNPRAQTLMEILVASILVGLSVSALGATFMWTKGRNVISQHQVQAVDFAKEALEELLLTKNYSDLTNDGNYPMDLPQASELKSKFSGTRAYTVSTIAEGKQITVTVSWKEEDQSREEKLYGLVIQR